MLNIVQQVLNDTLRSAPEVKYADVCGSLARRVDFADNSDIDIVVDTGGREWSDSVVAVLLGIRSILYDQFRRKTDFIDYGLIKKYNNFKQMSADLIWLYDSGNHEQH